MPKKPTDSRNERLAEISRAMILSKGRPPIAELALQFKVTERMIRNDIHTLMDSKFWESSGSRTQYLRRRAYHELQRESFVDLKSDVASHTVNLLFTDPNSSISLSPGTTALIVAGQMIVKQYPSQIVTNNVAVTELPLDDSITVTLTGGAYSRGIHALIGTSAIQGFTHLGCRFTVVGVSGIATDPSRGPMLYVHHDAELLVLQEQVKSASEKIFVVCTFEKLSRSDPWPFAHLESLSLRAETNASREVILITNDPDEPSLQSRIGDDRYRHCRNCLDKLQEIAEKRSKFKVVLAQKDEESFEQLCDLVPWVDRARPVKS